MKSASYHALSAFQSILQQCQNFIGLEWKKTGSYLPNISYDMASILALQERVMSLPYTARDHSVCTYILVKSLEVNTFQMIIMSIIVPLGTIPFHTDPPKLMNRLS